MQPALYNYLDCDFLLTPLQGGLLSVTLWQGERTDQVCELGIFQDEAEALEAAVEWVSKRAARHGNGKA